MTKFNKIFWGWQLSQVADWQVKHIEDHLCPHQGTDHI